MTHEITAVSSRAQEICVSTAQRYAAAAYDDGLTEDTLRALASLACWGKHQQNVERDLHRWMPYAHGSRLTTHSTVIEVYDPDTASVQQKEIPILLASDVLHSLWSRQQLMACTTALLALVLSILDGRYRIGIAAKGNLVLQFFEDNVELHIQINSSWLVLNCAPSVNHLTLQKESTN